MKYWLPLRSAHTAQIPHSTLGLADSTPTTNMGRACNVEVEDQPHLLQCNMLIEEGETVQNTPNYSDLFCDDVGKIAAVSRTLQRKFTLLKNFNNQSAPNTVTFTCNSNGSASTLPRQSGFG